VIGVEIFLGFFLVLIPVSCLVLLIVFITKTNALTHRVEMLESQMRYAWEKREAPTVTPRTAQQPAAAAVPPAQSPVASPRPVVAPATPVAPAAQVTLSPAPVTPEIERWSVDTMPAPSRTREEWEALIGGKLLNRIGALALIIGIGFFLKYAFDNNWLTETMRVIIGVVAGAGLLFGAARAHGKGYAVFAQGLVGAGLATLYLSIFASFNFYHLVPQVVAFFLMSGVTILAFLQAFRYDSMAVSFIGAIGGFLTPFMLSTGEANQIGLFTYLALLDAGVLAVVIIKDKWAALEPTAFVLTAIIFGGWFDRYYADYVLLRTTYFLVIFWALFFLVDLYRGIKPSGSFVQMRSVLAALNTLLFYSCLYAMIETLHHEAMGAATLAVGLVYFGSGLFVQRKNLSASNVLLRQIVTAMIMLILATAIQFTGFRTIQWWAGEALILMYCGVRWEKKFVWAGGAMLFGVALLKLVALADTFSTEPVVSGMLLFNQRAATLVILFSAIAAGSSILRRVVAESRATIANLLDYVWPLLVYLLVTVETVGFFESLIRGEAGTAVQTLLYKRGMSLPVLWMVTSLLLMQAGITWLRKPLAFVGLGLTAVAFVFAAVEGIAYEAITDFTPILNFRVLTLLLLLGGCASMLMLVRGSRVLGEATEPAAGTVGIFFVVLLFVLLTGETRDIFERNIAALSERSTEGPSIFSRVSDLQNLKQLCLSGIWLTYSIGLMGVGIWRRRRGVRIASIFLFGFTILKIFIYDLSSLETLYRIFSFMGLGIILLLVSWLYQRYKDLIFAREESPSSPAPGI
jgi:uncharacterized membrane protein